MGMAHLQSSIKLRKQVTCTGGLLLKVGSSCRLIGFDDAIHRAVADTLWRIEVTFAFYTGLLVDYIQNAVALTDGFGWAIGYACAAGDAIFSYFHGHGCFS
jgi:hypothetical protein